MTSPFADYANATLVFEVATGAFTTDNFTGNRKLTRTALTVTAILTEKRMPNLERAPGVDQQAIYLEGYAIEVSPLAPDANPSLLPAEIRPNTWAACTWAGVTGQFYLLLTGRSPYGVANETGDRLRGWFQTKV